MADVEASTVVSVWGHRPRAAEIRRSIDAHEKIRLLHSENHMLLRHSQTEAFTKLHINVHSLKPFSLTITPNQTLAKMTLTDEVSTQESNTRKWALYGEPRQVLRVLRAIEPEQEWTEDNLKDPKHAKQGMSIMEKVARENAPEGTDPFEVDPTDVKAGLFLGLSEEDAIELGRYELVRRLNQYISKGIKKLEAERGLVPAAYVAFQNS